MAYRCSVGMISSKGTWRQLGKDPVKILEEGTVRQLAKTKRSVSTLVQLDPCDVFA